MSFTFDDPEFTIALKALEDVTRAVEGVFPDLSNAVRIENWRLVWIGGSLGLIGEVFGHPHILDGRRALTSTLAAIDVERRWAISQNRVYRLGRSAFEMMH